MRRTQEDSRLPKVAATQRYLFPFVCFGCRKTFRKPHSVAHRFCPQCRQPMTMLGRKFHSPKSSDAKQWKKVQILAELGFYFQSVYRATPEGGKRVASYPRTIQEIEAFVQEFREQAISQQPSAWRSARTAAIGSLSE